MAIFEQKLPKKVLLDDTECLKCVIENYHNINGHTEYIIRVQRGPSREKSWHIYKRYNDFVALHSSLSGSGISLPLPPKKLLGNTDREFIAERQLALQKYLNIVLMNPILASALTTKKFVDPDNYSTPFHEVALQQVSLALRGEVGWEVVGPLSDIGWRLRKHYFHVRCRSSSIHNANHPNETIASWLDYGPDKYLDDRDMHAIFRSLSQFQHPFIQPIELCLCSESGALIVRKFLQNGTLRDFLCGAKPKQSFLKKYGCPKGHKKLPIDQIARYGRQILELLHFLHEKGLPYGNLHTGNLIIDEEQKRIRILDIENGVLGVPSFYRPYFIQHRRINTLKTIDVYSFGHVLYEMAFGNPLHESICDILPDNCPPTLKSIIMSILSAEACKVGLPSIDELLSNPFFSSVSLGYLADEKAHLKIPTNVKELLRVAQQHLEVRLHNEQKMVKSQKRLVKVQELMSSEEEKKKRKQKAKQDQKEQKHKEEKERQRQISAQNSAEKPDTNNTTPASSGTGTPQSVKGLCVPVPPPPPPMMAPPPPPPMFNGSPPKVLSPTNERSALLGSICNFNKNSLRKTNSNAKK